MKKLLFVPVLACLAVLVLVGAISYCANAATIQWYSQQTPTTSLSDNDVLVVEVSGPQGYRSFQLSLLKDWIGANGSDTFVTNLYATNFYSTNTYIQVAYVTNLWTTNAYITNATIYNLRGNSSVINNSYVSNLYSTNIYAPQTITNYYLFSTNLYLSYPTYTNNTYVSNYFQTNAFLNTYVSNYFNTNLFNYFTNLYTFSTNLTVTNFYLTDNYISNFFNTNIFVNNSYVSNFFATNIYNAYQITSNYYYQVYANLTNPTIAGLITSIGSSNYADPSMFMFSQTGDALKLLTAPTPSIQMVGSTPGSIILYSNTSQSISMNANGGAITAGGNVNARGFSHYTLNWSGPTNSIAAGDDDLYYASDTSIKITGFTGLPSDGLQTAEGLITYTNKQSTNVTITLPAGLVIPERTLSVTLSNASQGMLSWKYSQKAGTNGVYRQF